MSLRILAFEPDSRDFDQIVAALHHSAMDCTVDRVVSRDQMMDALRTMSPDVLLIDYARSDGEALQATLWSRNTDLPVLMVSKPVGDAEAVRAMRAGASDFVLTSELPRLADAIRVALRKREEAEKERRAQQELRSAAEKIRENQKMVTIGRLTGMITHEINNPLEAIANLLYLLRHEGSLSPQAIAYLDIAEREMARVVQISHQTLSFYRDSTSPVRQRPHELVDEVLALYRRKLSTKNITVRTRYDFRGTLLLYPGELRQVLSNLVVNAIDAMEPGGRLILHVYRTRRWSDARLSGVRIVVADTGTGIPADKLRHIGEPFFTTKGQQGTGLGLWVSQGIMRKYGGDLQISSSTNPMHHGSVFSIFLPEEMGPKAAGSDGSRKRSEEHPATGTGLLGAREPQQARA
jgi:signal transduction histidine kinase